jgi:hypothetical protein
MPYIGRFLAAAVAAGCLAGAGTAQAQCVAVLRDGGFEMQTGTTVGAPWVAEGTAGIDLGRGLAHSNLNNAWARRSTGWNAIRQRVRLFAGKTYVLTGFVRTSGNVRAGYFGFRNAAQHPVAEVRFGSLPGYSRLRVSFRPTATGWYNVFTGFWAPGQDAWIRGGSRGNARSPLVPLLPLCETFSYSYCVSRK